MFTRLLERKLWANKNEDVIDTVFFDENIRFKLNRYKKNSKNQQLTPFLDDKSQNHASTFECEILSKIEREITPELFRMMF